MDDFLDGLHQPKIIRGSWTPTIQDDLANFFLPHTATVTPQNQVVNGTSKVAGNPSDGSPFTIQCDIQPMTPGQAFRDFGVETRGPAVMYFKVSDLDSINAEDRVTHDGSIYCVTGDPFKQDDGFFPLKHAVALLDKMQF